MSGHSKWANIKHRKARVDAQKGKLFTRLGRELIVAARLGGGDPEANPRLKLAIQRAREANMPMENIQRAIQKGTGEIAGETYEEVVYEGYGPGGVAIMLSLATDNRNRTASEIRHLFSRYGGNLGESGCVAWMFESRGLITVELEDVSQTADDIMLWAIEAGAEDVNLREEDNFIEIVTEPGQLEQVRKALEGRRVAVASAEVTMLPKTTVSISDPELARRVLRLVDVLEDHDDVQAVYANFDIPASLMRELEEGAAAS
ncbi:MAG: YebC/PmpR family DNA-binding transcriptional regulator [Clostridia bacterium]|nr:YebC/PmpR family DNA-binding transcriptional regulator [Clostridia bacterium]MDH7572769.1 YebC/PmpR family DNA-binding transcriptional regulator [Clostridia bacterium]